VSAKDPQMQNLLDIIKYADPHRERTLGVITKLDLMTDDSFHEVDSLFSNITCNLRLGYSGIVCRSDKANLKGITL
jgi:hypothetical protein